MKTEKELKEKLIDLKLRLTLNELDDKEIGIPKGLTRDEYRQSLISMLSLMEWILK